MVSDLGASLDPVREREFTRSASLGKGHLAAYMGSTLIKSNTTEGVDFGAPKGPAALDVLAFPIYMRRMERRWIGKEIPTEHVRLVRNHSMNGGETGPPKACNAMLNIIAGRFLQRRMATVSNSCP